MANFVGDAGNNNLLGTPAADNFDISQGGTDTVGGGLGDDVIIAGATFDILDQINGGQDYDLLDVIGDYSAGLTFTSTTLRNVEEIHVGSGFSYKFITDNATVNAGGVLKIDGHNMTAGESLYVDGSAETNGGFLFYDGVSNDTMIGGAQYDNISMSYGGNDTVYAGGGGDVIGFDGAFNNSDVIDGGAGNDVLYLRGNYGAGLAIGASAMTSIETLGLLGDFTYALNIADGVVAAGQNLYVTGAGISGSGHMIVNGSSETDGTYSFQDSIGNDILSGGANADQFLGFAGGSDTFQGLGGDDSFGMYGNLDATDEIYGGLGTDWVSLDGDYSAGVTFDMFTINGIEQLSFTAGHSYNITTDDANVGPGKQLDVRADGLGVTETAIFDGSAELDGNFLFVGGQGNDIFSGGAGDDYFSASNGGADTFHGGGGNDSVNFFGSYTTADFIDGGDGSDSVFIGGDFLPLLTLGSAQMQNVESISLGTGFDYNVKALDSLVAAGATLAVSAYFSPAGESFVFNGNAETDGHFSLTGGDGDDQLTGGQQSDTFLFNRSGTDIMNGRGGGDTFFVSTDFTAADSLIGGAGYDLVALNANLGAGLVLGATTLTGIEEISLFAGQSYKLTTNDGNVAANQLLTVAGQFLGTSEVLTFNGSAETDGRFLLKGGAAGDSLQGGAMNDQILGNNGDDVLRGNGGNDLLTGGLGRDHVYGGAGNDKFIYTAIAESGIGAASDVIHDWNAGDRINLSAIDTDAVAAGDQGFSFIGAAAFSAAGQLQVTNDGTNTFVRADMDGDGTADFAIRVLGTPAMAAGDFIL